MTTPFRLNENLLQTASPPIPQATTWSLSYPATPESPLLNLAQGVPGAPPPTDFLKRLSQAALDPATTNYGDLRGDEGLRKALINDINTVYDGDVGLDEVVLTSGCNLAFYAAILALAKAGDEVILPTPWYFNQEMTLTQLGVHAVPLPCSAPTFFPSPAVARDLITEKTRAIVLVTPNNPTGAIYPPELLQEFADLVREKKLALILDETYREFIVERRPHYLFQDAKWRDYLVHLFSFSKSYAIPGHRLGALVASPAFQHQIHKTLDCLQICPARPAQRAVEWAVEGTRDWRKSTSIELFKRGEIFTKVMKEVVGNPWDVEVVGGYFAYVKHPYPGTSSTLVASRLASLVGLIVLPGAFFGPPLKVEDDRYLRFSIANVSADTLAKVPERLTKLNALWDSL